MRADEMLERALKLSDDRCTQLSRENKALKMALKECAAVCGTYYYKGRLATIKPTEFNSLNERAETLRDSNYWLDITKGK
jgi:hypothetical protein